MKTIGITKMDLANVGSGAGFKEAAEQKVSGTLQGIGTVEADRLNEETGELEPVQQLPSGALIEESCLHPVDALRQGAG